MSALTHLGNVEFELDIPTTPPPPTAVTLLSNVEFGLFGELPPDPVTLHANVGFGLFEELPIEPFSLLANVRFSLTDPDAVIHRTVIRRVGNDWVAYSRKRWYDGAWREV